MREARMPENVVKAMCEAGAAGAQWRVAMVLYLHADKDGRCNPSVSTIEDLTKLPRRTVTRALIALGAAGIFGCDKAPGRANAYRLTTRDAEVPATRDAEVPTTRDAEVPSEDSGLGTPVTATRDTGVLQLGTPASLKQKTFEQKTFEHSAGSPQLADEFENWWGEYGRIGDKARAFDCYRWWRTKGRAPADDLLTAAVRYREHCAATACLMKHGATFLAKPAKGRSPVWPEWATGEGHGAMDVGAASRLNDVLVAGAQAFGLNGGENGDGARQTIQHGRRTGVIDGREIARRSLPEGKLEG